MLTNHHKAILESKQQRDSSAQQGLHSDDVSQMPILGMGVSRTIHSSIRVSLLRKTSRTCVLLDDDYFFCIAITRTCLTLCVTRLMRHDPVKLDTANRYCAV